MELTGMEKLYKLESAVHKYMAATSRVHNFLGFLVQLSGPQKESPG